MQAKKYNLPFVKTLRWILFLLGVAFTATLFISKTLFYCFPSLPSEKNRIIFYSNQDNTSLKTVTLKALESAKTSILLHSFSLTDKAVLGLLIKKNEELSSCIIKTDLKPTPSYYPLIKTILSWERIPCSGLMHEKFLIIDKLTTFLGTANMTTESLVMHDNLIVGIFDRIFSTYLTSTLEEPTKVRKKKSHFKKFRVENQEISLWLLPSKEPKGLKSLLSYIDGAQKSIKVSIFTLTHPLILKALIAAHERGVKLDIFLDKSSFEGASKKSADYLISHGITIKTSIGIQLLHHKMALIDDNIFIFGSANWTKSAFEKNRDFLASLTPLSADQLKVLHRIFYEIKKHSR